MAGALRETWSLADGYLSTDTWLAWTSVVKASRSVVSVCFARFHEVWPGYCRVEFARLEGLRF